MAFQPRFVASAWGDVYPGRRPGLMFVEEKIDNQLMRTWKHGP
jgi:hypothetical protein